jgi:hypothetical protein
MVDSFVKTLNQEEMDASVHRDQGHARRVISEFLGTVTTAKPGWSAAQQSRLSAGRELPKSHSPAARPPPTAGPCGSLIDGAL